MHKRAELNGLLVTLDSLTPGKQQQWLQQQPLPKTKKEAQHQAALEELEHQKRLFQEAQIRLNQAMNKELSSRDSYNQALAEYRESISGT